MAKKSQGAIFAVSTATSAAKTITGITAANPAVVTSTAHGLSNGTIVMLAGIAGMVQLNNRAFVVANTATNTFELKGVDATTYTAYSSGGTATPHTMTAIGEVKSASGFDGQAAEIETTHLQSTAKEYLQGLQDFGNVSLTVNRVTDTGQARLRTLKDTQVTTAFSITDSAGLVASFPAFVKSFTFDMGGPDTAITGQISLRVAAAAAEFA